VDGVLVRRAASLSPFLVVKRPESLVRYRLFGANTSNKFNPPRAASATQYQGWLASLAQHEVGQHFEARKVLSALTRAGAPGLVLQRARTTEARARGFAQISQAARMPKAAFLLYCARHVGDPHVGGHCRNVLRNSLK
jgi:hypothetical protein